MKRVYLDNNATTGVDPRVLEAMLPELSPHPANPSSQHYEGKQAKSRLSKARETIARYLKVKPQEIIFTSGGTESLALLLHSAQGHVITSNVEHSSVENTLKKAQCEVTYLPVGTWGAVQPAQVALAIRPHTKLIVLSAVNSETGVKTDLKAMADLASQANIPLIIDSVALLGKEPFTLYPGITGMAFSGHKFHAPKGIGFALIRSHYKVPSILSGGSQEYAKRAGTENLPGIIGLAEAIKLLDAELPTATEQMATLRDYFENELKKRFKVEINGEGPRVANTSNISFSGVDGETLLMNLDMAGISASHGSACASGALEPSRILTQMGYQKERVRSSIRFSLSRWTTLEDINHTLMVLSHLMT